jgi:predicted nucleotidyltransferase
MPTILDLPRDEWQPYIEAVRQQPEPPELTPAERQEREHLLDRVREAADALKQRFRAQRVYLFGSLAHAAWFTPASDVDLAVEGLTGDDYWQAWRMVEDIIGDRPVDLVVLETIRGPLLDTIHRQGVEL